MKGFIIGTILFGSVFLAADAVTFFYVHKTDGSVDKYNVENVESVYYKVVEPTIDTTGTYAQGVSVNGQVGLYTYVDLGLPSGIKWATYNVGSNAPSETGSMCCWGSTSLGYISGYSSYRYNNAGYKFSNDTCKTFSKYVTSSDRGNVDNLTVLDSVDDAATYSWGVGWRMPTATEAQELIDGCDWEYTYVNNKQGYLGTSKANGNTIFFPLSEYAYWSYHQTEAWENIYITYTQAFIWTSSLDENDSKNAYFVWFPNPDGSIYDYSDHVQMKSNSRSLYCEIRAVLKE